MRKVVWFGLYATLLAGVAFPQQADAAFPYAIRGVYVCGETVEIQLADGTADGLWLMADTGDGTTTVKMVDRIYAAAMGAWLGQRTVSWYYYGPAAAVGKAVSNPPCLPERTGYRIDILHVAG